MGAGADAFAAIQHISKQCFSTNPLQSPASKFLCKHAAFVIVQQHPSAALADALQDLQGVAEIADVKDGEFEGDVAEMTGAVCQHLSTGLARGSFVADSEARVQDAVWLGATLWHFVESPLKDMKFGSVDDLRRRHKAERNLFAAQHINREID